MRLRNLSYYSIFICLLSTLVSSWKVLHSENTPISEFNSSAQQSITNESNLDVSIDMVTTAAPIYPSSMQTSDTSYNNRKKNFKKTYTVSRNTEDIKSFIQSASRQIQKNKVKLRNKKSAKLTASSSFLVSTTKSPRRRVDMTTQQFLMNTTTIIHSFKKPANQYIQGSSKHFAKDSTHSSSPEQTEISRNFSVNNNTPSMGYYTDFENSHIKSTITAPTGSIAKNHLEYSTIYDNYSSLPDGFLYDRQIVSLDDLTLADIVVVTDVEGGVHGLLRATGEVLWSKSASIFGSMLEVGEPQRLNAPELLAVEPYDDGVIYSFNVYQGIRRLPVTVKDLVESSPMNIRTDIVVDSKGTVVKDEKFFTGSRSTSIYTIDLFTGEILSAFGEGTENKIYKNFTKDSMALNKGSLLVLGRVNYHLDINSNEGLVYNISYSQWQSNVDNRETLEENFESRDDLFISPFKDKSLLAIDYDLNMAKWVSPTFPGIINSVFDIYVDEFMDENVVVPHPKFNPNEVRDPNLENMVFMGSIDDGSWFCLSGKFYPGLVSSSSLSRFSSSDRWRLASILKNDALFKTAVTGVHVLLDTVEYDQKFDEAYGDKIHYNKNKELIDKPQDFPIDKYRSFEDIEIAKLKKYRKLIQEEKQSNVRTFMGQLGYRLFENSILLLLGLVAFRLLQDFKIFPKYHDIVNKTNQPRRIDSNELVEITQIDSKQETMRQLSNNGVSVIELSTLASNDLATNSDDNVQLLNIQTKDFKEGFKNLIVFEKILGYGSSGTIVFEGRFQDRPVAVKRMLLDFCYLALQEIKLLTESDDHPNVIRYYCSETTDKFAYIALELCDFNLDDLLQKTIKSNKGPNNINIRKLLVEIASGVSYLHSLNIIHRDIKPQNILLSKNKKYIRGKETDEDSFRVLISDFGLCKKLETGQSSFQNSTKATGTTGWRAPELIVHSSDFNELLIGKNKKFRKIMQSTEEALSNQRLTKSIDIFSMGCVFYYVLTNGLHPFGDIYNRDANIIKNKFTLNGLKRLMTDVSLAEEATDLILKMIAPEPLARPSAEEVLNHPFLWTPKKKLEFLLEFSDRLELETSANGSEILTKLEEISTNIIPDHDWSIRFDKTFLENIQKYRFYNTRKLQHLLRALRNKFHHHSDLPPNVYKLIAPLPDGYYFYYSKRFPSLLLETYKFAKENMRDEPSLKRFFDTN